MTEFFAHQITIGDVCLYWIISLGINFLLLWWKGVKD